MEQASIRMSHQKWLQQRANVQRVCWRGVFVRDRGNFFLARLFENGIDEAGPVRPKNPRNPNDQRAIVRLQRAAFPFPFRFSVNANRPRFVFLGVRLPLLAIENVVGADVNESRFLRAADFRKEARRFRVEGERFLLVVLAAIDIRLRRGVDQRVKTERTQRGAQLCGRAEVELRVIEAHHVVVSPVLTHERCAEPSASSNNDNSPARFHPTDSKGMRQRQGSDHWESRLIHVLR